MVFDLVRPVIGELPTKNRMLFKGDSLGTRGLAFLAGACCAIAEPIISVGDPVVAIDEDISSHSNYPGGQSPALAVDGSTATKYLNFGRDPLGWEIFGTNANIVTESNGTGQNEPWDFIAGGTMELPAKRFAEGAEVFFSNNTAYSSYKFVVRSVKDPVG